MLDAMRRGAVNWLAKILLGLLIVAFALWGVADVFRNYGRGTLARLGNTEISVDEYRKPTGKRWRRSAAAWGGAASGRNRPRCSASSNVLCRA